MSHSLTLKEWRIAALVLLVVGLERLLNAYLISGQAVVLSTRFVIGVLCTAVGTLLLVLTVHLRRPP